MYKKRVVLVLVLLLVTSGCVAKSVVEPSNDGAGFFLGVWHGWIAPIALILKLFNNNIAIYETNNIGWWYDFGFYIAIISGFGGISLTRKKYISKSD